jgi:hypothetical protein
MSSGCVEDGVICGDLRTRVLKLSTKLCHYDTISSTGMVEGNGRELGHLQSFVQSFGPWGSD